jgi:hypothetical protein
MNILCKGVVEIRNKFIPNYYTDNPNEEYMIDLFELCHTELLPNVSLHIRKISVLFWMYTHYPPYFYLIGYSYFCCFLLHVLVFS